jgi:hypothetical protein
LFAGAYAGAYADKYIYGCTNKNIGKNSYDATDNNLLRNTFTPYKK